MRRLPAIVAACVVVYIAILSQACSSSDTRSFVPNVDTLGGTPTMTTVDVSTYITDSGYTRYHIVAPRWLIFDDTTDPSWHFPDGLQMEQYDLAMHPQADISCLQATYYTRRRLWRLDGEVVMVNVDRDSFLTQQLFWDQASRTVYTDSFVHIVRSDRIIEGYGMKSNENMTAYTVRQTTAILPASRPGEKAPAPDTVAPTQPSAGERPRAVPERASVRAARADTASPTVRDRITITSPGRR